MNTPFTFAQIVRFKNYKRNDLEKEAYFVVIQEADATHELVLYTLTTNRLYTCGTTLIPEFPNKDLQRATITPLDLLKEEVTMIKGPIENELTGVIVNSKDDAEYITFSLVDSFLVSNIKVDYHSSKNQLLRGNIHISLHY